MLGEPSNALSKRVIVNCQNFAPQNEANLSRPLEFE